MPTGFSSLFSASMIQMNFQARGSALRPFSASSIATEGRCGQKEKREKEPPSFFHSPEKIAATDYSSPNFIVKEDYNG
jgi:hypothetical protein